MRGYMRWLAGSLLLALVSSSAAWAAGHRVLRAGETLAGIAQEAGVSVAALQTLNSLKPGQEPPVGTVLLLPDTDTVQAQRARVLSVTGSGRITLPGGETQPLACGAWMAPGAIICTGVESFATVRLASDTARAAYDDIRLSSSTCLTVVDAAGGAARSSLVNLSEGSVQVEPSVDERGLVTVQTPVSLTSAEGGGFRVTLEDEAARTEALSDAVVVMAAGQEVPLDAGEGSRVRAGEQPSAPVTLLDTGFLLKPDRDSLLLRPDFAWTPVDQALGYRIQIATSPDFSRLLYQEDVPYPEWRPDFLMLPHDVPALWWRVSSFDRLGFESLPSAPRQLRVPREVSP